MAIRQLSVIMFTDIVGYTALMGRDEQKAFALLQKNRSIQKPLVLQHRGKWLKEIGDGVLACFDSVIDAVNCAAAIQQVCKNQQDLKLRIGIHLGEVVFENNDVFGDGVNIASRLEPMAPVGGILVSDAVQKNLFNKKGIKSTFSGNRALKNVPEKVGTYILEVDPVAVQDIDLTFTSREVRKNQTVKKYALFGILLVLIITLVLYLTKRETLPSSMVNLKSIAVLPFENLSGASDFEYFADGMSQELCNRLANIENLRVTARRACLRYKGTAQPPLEIATELGVAYLVEGNVRKSGNEIRINSQLIDGSTGVQLASYAFTGSLDQVLEAQDQAAFGIASELNVDLNPQEVAAIKRRPTKNNQAYDSYLKGWMLFESTHADLFPSKGKLDLAHSYFKSAAEIDTNFALAYAGLSLVESFFISMDSDAAFNINQNAKSLAEKSLTIDPQLAEGYLALAELALVTDEHRSAIESFKKSLELNPENPIGWCHLAFSCLNSGDYGTAEQSARIAIKQQPTYIWSHFQLGKALRSQGRLGEAIQSFEYCTSLNDSWYLPHLLMGEIRFDQQEYLLAKDSFLKAELISDIADINLNLSQTYTMLDEESLTFKELEKAFQKGYKDFEYVRSIPHFENLNQAALNKLIDKYE